MIFFTLYERKKSTLFARYGNNSKLSVTAASLYASFLTSVFTQPIWVLYTRVQLNTDRAISVLAPLHLGIH
jgi:hypothetical protein